ncbi:hypothetical protein [Rhodobaculum claviforme]|uniref:hypothetical protein n=1 Tax=Rhodobaculum claviforme TaxID=1549854 RepID=UPI0019147362|nr:hypothetical protein [Rhodobaculum claviforme]
MKIKVTLAAAVLALAPGMAAAMCSWEKTQQSASQCGAGQVWDAESQGCVTPVSS